MTTVAEYINLDLARYYQERIPARFHDPLALDPAELPQLSLKDCLTYLAVANDIGDCDERMTSECYSFVAKQLRQQTQEPDQYIERFMGPVDSDQRRCQMNKAERLLALAQRFQSSTEEYSLNSSFAVQMQQIMNERCL